MRSKKTGARTWLISFYGKDKRDVVDHGMVRGSKIDALKLAIKHMKTNPPRVYGFHIREEKHGGY